MASKTQHVQDNSVLERRLRPIYDSLDFGNNKKALQEAEKVLKKSPTLQCARALKALATLRLGKDVDSEALLDILIKEKPSDESTLQVMTICYREMNQMNKICEVYDNAVKQNPSNEELLTHLFMSYVRVHDFKAQQSAALLLYKAKPKNPYYFWAVMSVVLQAIRGPESTNTVKKSLLLALAERMIDKIINDNKMEAEQECQLYIIILELQNKHKEALTFLDGSVGSRLLTSSTTRCRLDILRKLEMWPELNSTCKALLWDNVDRWDYYLDYLSSAFQLFTLSSTDLSTDSKDSPDTSPEQCLDFICQLIEVGKGLKLRGPFLARIELYRMMKDKNMDAKSLMGDYIELLVDYFRKFGDRGCCIGDLRKPIQSLPKLEDDNDQKQGTCMNLASRLIQEVGISSTVLPQSKQQMQSHISSLQLSRLCGAHTVLTPEHLEALFTALTLHYEHGRTSYGQNLLSTDLGPSDPYAIIATHVMFDLSKKLNDSRALVEGLLLLHYVLHNSPSNFHAKLLCLQIYHILGCGLGASEMYESLDVKHLQLDSLGYLHCAPMSVSNAPSSIQKLHDTTLNFFTHNYKDSIEHLTLSYKFGSFSKLFEFMDFRERLSNSLHNSSVTVDRLLGDLIKHPVSHTETVQGMRNMRISPSEDKIDWMNICDNRDWKVITHWDPATDGDDQKEKTFEQNVDVLRIRSFIVRLMFAALAVVDPESQKENIHVLKTLILEFESLFKDTIIKNHPKLELCSLSSPMPSRIHGILALPYDKIFSSITHFLLNLINGNNDTVISCEWIQTITQNVQFTIVKQNESKDPLWSHRSCKETVVNSIEVLVLTSILCGLCCDLTKTYTKKSKKRGDTSLTSQNPVSTLMISLKQSLEAVDKALESWNIPILQPKNISKKLECLSLVDKKEHFNFAIFENDFNIFIKEYKLIVKENVKYLSKLNV